MDDLVEFLRARLDEDAEVAREAEDEITTMGGSWYGVAHVALSRAGYDDVADHLERHSSARVLADVEAKRKTLVRCEEAMLSANPMLVHFAEQTVREMALPYAEHPEYQEERRP